MDSSYIIGFDNSDENGLLKNVCACDFCSVFVWVFAASLSITGVGQVVSGDNRKH